MKSVWCHLCNIEIIDQEAFKRHIIKKHTLASEFYDDSDRENSEENETVETFDDIDESEIDEDLMDEQSDEEIGNFSSSNSCSDNTSQIHANTIVLNTRRKTEKETDSKEKIDLKFSDSISDQKIASSELIDNNKILYIMNPDTSQEMKGSSLMGNQSIQQPMCMFNNVSDQLPLPNIRGGFEFNSRNVLIWLVKFKEMSRALKFPVQQSLFEKIKTVHKGIFDNYNTATSSELTSSVMKVYEELDNMIHKHIASINEQL